jgi:hypothetical protein
MGLSPLDRRNFFGLACGAISSVWSEMYYPQGDLAMRLWPEDTPTERFFQAAERCRKPQYLPEFVPWIDPYGTTGPAGVFRGWHAFGTVGQFSEGCSYPSDADLRGGMPAPGLNPGRLFEAVAECLVLSASERRTIQAPFDRAFYSFLAGGALADELPALVLVIDGHESVGVGAGAQHVRLKDALSGAGPVFQPRAGRGVSYLLSFGKTNGPRLDLRVYPDLAERPPGADSDARVVSRVWTRRHYRKDGLYAGCGMKQSIGLAVPTAKDVAAMRANTYHSYQFYSDRPKVKRYSAVTRVSVLVLKPYRDEPCPQRSEAYQWDYVIHRQSRKFIDSSI